LTEHDARRRAEEGRAAAAIDPGWPAVAAERRFILVAGPDPQEPSRVRDVLAWVVRFGGGISWAELAVDDRTGAVLRVERSR
jgi:hypothetical protein